MHLYPYQLINHYEFSCCQNGNKWRHVKSIGVNPYRYFRHFLFIFKNKETLSPVINIGLSKSKPTRGDRKLSLDNTKRNRLTDFRVTELEEAKLQADQKDLSKIPDVIGNC
jgi:hypothetical protein